MGIKKWLGIEDQSNRIEARLLDLKSSLSAEYSILKAENSALRELVRKKDAEIHTLNSQIREQDEADLFYQCEKIKKRLLDDETKQEIKQDLMRYNSLKVIVEAHQQMMKNQLGGF